MLSRVVRWILPGLRLKRWLAALTGGAAVSAAGLVAVAGRTHAAAVVVAEAGAALAALDRLGLRLAVGAALLAGGVAAMSFSLGRLIGSILEALASPPLPVRGGAGLAEAVYRSRGLGRGPRVVAIGGGTGLPVLLRGLKAYTSNVTAVVAVSDDGGSSGRLRGELGILPPGDLRNCLLALAETEPLLEQLLQHRFEAGSGLAGHAFGNLFIAAMCEITGDFEEAIRQSSRVLAVRGQVLPATSEDVKLAAELVDGTVVEGESLIPQAGRPIRRVFLTPPGARATPAVLAAIAEADLIVLGPGSLYTSVIPNLLIEDVAAAVRASRATKVYVVNVMTQPGETDGKGALEHVQAILDHAGRVMDYALVNGAPVPPEVRERYAASGAEPVTAPERTSFAGVRIVVEDVLARDNLARHDADRLARAVLRLLLRDRRRRGARRLLDDFLLALLIRRRDRLEGRRTA